MDEDTDQHSHPLFRMSPGMKMLGAEEEKESNVTAEETRDSEEKKNPIFPGNNTDNISKCGDIHEPPTMPTHGKAANGRSTNEEARPKDQSPSRKQRYVQASRPPHRTGGRLRGTKGQQPLRSRLARMSASATSTPFHQDDSKFFTKKRRNDSTSAQSSRDTKQTVP